MTVPARRVTAVAALLAGSVVLSGCGSSSGTPAAAGAGGGTAAGAPAVTGSAGGTAAAPSATPDCPTPAGTVGHFPALVPASIPAPPGTHVTSAQTTSTGLKLLRYTTTQSLRQSVLFLLTAMPKAGYVIGRGDAEYTEADAPFVARDGSLRGAVRMYSTAPCTTAWLLALAPQTPTGAGPVLPTYRPTSSPSPLPFHS